MASVSDVTALVAELKAGRSVLVYGEVFAEVVRRTVREELRRCGLRPPPPAGPGVYRFDEATDQWVRRDPA